MKPSDLRQRVFDSIFGGLALLDLMDETEIEEVAKGLEDPKNVDFDSEPMFKAVAKAIRMAKAK